VERKKRKKNSRGPQGSGLSLGRIPLYLWISLWAGTELFILFWMTYTSFKTNAEFLRDIWALPSSLRFENYINDLTGNTAPPVPVGQYLINSAIVSFGSVVGILAIAVPGGYALSKKSRVTDILFFFFLAMIAVPPPAVLIPLFYTVRNLGLGNTYLGLILPYIAFNVPFSVVLARAFFKSFPRELEEAAKVDGLSDLGVFFRIVAPLSSIIVVILLVVNFPNVWNELLYAIVILQTDNVRTIQPGLLLFSSAFGSQWSQIFAGMILSSLPMIVFYIIFQRYVARAQFVGAVKG
jgi:raffinose/stachyose/melibiose transport system permease protein